MAQPFSYYERFVQKHLSQRIFVSMWNYVLDNEPVLWGENQPRGFLKANFVLALYKDIKDIGYQKLLKSVTDLRFKLNHKSLQKNVERLRAVLANWAKRTIRLGAKTDWTAAARNVSLRSPVKDAVLWMDSKDFPVIGKRTVSRKGPNWSFKCNSPAQRFMFLRNGKGKVCQVWGGYSPKTFDGHWLRDHKEWLMENLDGAAVLADNHFMWGKKHLKNVTFHCNTATKACCREDEEEYIEDPISKQKTTYNNAVKQGRARVENTFGEMVQKFEALATPWKTKLIQQDHLVYMAIGVFNESRDS